MSRVVRLLLCNLILLGFLAGTGPTSAQADVRLASLLIDLWPEFDEPSMLVILDGTLQPDVPLPATVTLRLPARVTAPNAVAMKDADGQLLTAPYTTALQGDDLLVTLTSDYAEFRVEYYDPALTVEGSARRYEFRWTSDYPVDSAVIRVQEPSGAMDLVADPAVTASGVADFGLNYYGKALGALTAGQTLALSLGYTKSSAALSADALGLNAAAPAAEASAASAPAELLAWPILLAVAGGVLLAGGGAYYWISSRARASRAKSKTQPHRARARSRAAPTSAAGRAAPTPSPAHFCTSCGHALQTGDRFCRDCGAPVKVSP